MASEDRELKKIFRYGQHIMVIASEGGNNDWAAYAENCRSRTRGNTEDAIHDHGEKLLYNEAASAFPNWDEGPLHWRE